MCLSGTRPKERASRISVPRPRIARSPSRRRDVSPWLGGADEDSRPQPTLRIKFVLPDLGSPFASKANVVAYDRHVLFASDDPANATRHRTPCPISTTRINEAFVQKLPEELVGLVFAQADALAYECELGVGSTSSHLPSRSLISLSMASRWWLANSVGTTLPFHSTRCRS
jgi:hypothetical protein